MRHLIGAMLLVVTACGQEGKDDRTPSFGGFDTEPLDLVVDSSEPPPDLVASSDRRAGEVRTGQLEADCVDDLAIFYLPDDIPFPHGTIYMAWQCKASGQCVNRTPYSGPAQWRPEEEVGDADLVVPCLDFEEREVMRLTWITVP